MTDQTLTLSLSTGDVVIRLRPDLAPKHVERITQLAADGWTLVAEIDLGSRLAKKNVNLPGGLVILEFTSGGATIPLLKNESTRYVAGLMPCSVSVYAMDDGRVVVSRMNAAAMAGMMEPKLGEVLKQSAARMDSGIQAALTKLAAN